jgi:ABC-type transporter Mla subunit MlaD
LQAAASELRTELSALGTDAAALIATFEETGAMATDRLREAELTLDRANTLLATLDTTAIAVEGAAARVDTLIAEEGAPLLAELRVVVADATRAIAVVTETAETDLPVMIADIRTAVSRATTMMDTVGADLTTASAGVSDVVAAADETLRQVTETFANANTTLGAINGALETGERTLDRRRKRPDRGRCADQRRDRNAGRGPQRQCGRAQRRRRDGRGRPAGDLRRYPGRECGGLRGVCRSSGAGRRLRRPACRSSRRRRFP